LIPKVRNAHHPPAYPTQFAGEAYYIEKRHMNLIDVAQQFGTPEACNDFLEKMRWPAGVACVHCTSKNVAKYMRQAGTCTRKNSKTGASELKPVPARILYVCRDCKKQFSVTRGTIFNDTHLPLGKWFMATALVVNAKKGVSAVQLMRDLNIAYKTAWHLSHRIRQGAGSCPTGRERFEVAIRALLNTAPRPMRAIPRKRQPKAKREEKRG
jgi:transposase-like protein